MFDFEAKNYFTKIYITPKTSIVAQETKFYQGKKSGSQFSNNAASYLFLIFSSYFHVLIKVFMVVTDLLKSPSALSPAGPAPYKKI